MSQARSLWEAALALYTELGDPDADEIRVRLAAVEARDVSPLPG